MKRAIALLLLTLLGASSSLHNQEEVPLRGFICKQNNVHKPCEICPTGYYCRDDKTTFPCGGNSVYCPLGSMSPTQVIQGFYSVGGTNTTRHDQLVAPKGYYALEGEKKVCPVGFYCPTPGMVSPIECGDSTVYCEEGASEPTQVLQGFYSVGGTNTTRHGQIIAPMGYYASNGIVLPCHEGHFGSIEGATHDGCSGICEAGWICPTASTSPRQIACGGEDRYCPTGSASPLHVQSGYYTTAEEEPCRPGTYRSPAASGDVFISPINTSRKEGKCQVCPEETFKHIAGDDASLCLECGTKAKSTVERITCECHQSATEKKLTKLAYNVMERKCGDIALPPDDYHFPNTQFTKTEEKPCQKGYYCQNGIRRKCSSGRFGNKDYEVREECTAECLEGYWCEEASTSSMQNKCGSPNVYCPSGSRTPIYVDDGFYTDIEEPHDTKTAQHICPKGYWCENGYRFPCNAGTFGESVGLSDMSQCGICSSGYYCEAASTTPHQYPCGNSTVFCPEGASAPILVDEGYYTSTKSEAVLADYYAGPNSTQQISVECEAGFYCKGGVKYSCPARTFGDRVGASGVSDCQICLAGFYCPSHPGPPTTNETLVACGEVDLYCPPGSLLPDKVDLGYYTVDAELRQALETTHIRTNQVEVEPGYFAQKGIRYPCPEGTYGETSGLATESCSGLCPRGYFCPGSSIHPLPCSAGAYSTGGAADCTSCNLPPSVPIDIIESICRDDRSCCLDAFDSAGLGV